MQLAHTNQMKLFLEVKGLKVDILVEFYIPFKLLF